MAAGKTSSVPAVDRAFDILDLIAQSPKGLSLPELVEQSGLPKSSVHALLLTLLRRGYLHRHGRSNRFMFGLKLFSLANMALSGVQLREQAALFLQGLVEKTGLTAHMAILEHQEGVIVAKCEPPGIFRLATWIGKRMDVHCTSLGKALLAYLDDGEVEKIIKEHGLPRHNDNTLCSRKKLKDELARTRKRGYAIDDEEDEVGLRCIGAPVFGADGRPAAAISLSGSTHQINGANLAQISKLLLETVKFLSESLLLSSPPPQP